MKRGDPETTSRIDLERLGRADPERLARDDVERLVRRARRADFALRAAEASCLGACAGLLCAAAARAEGSALSAPVWIAASVAGICAAATWMLERSRGSDAFAGALDRRLGLEGALVTVRNPAPSDSRVGELLTQRVQRVVADRGRRAILASTSPAWIAAPLLGAAVLALVADSSASSRDTRAPLADAAAALTALQSPDDGAQHETDAQVATLASDVRRWLERHGEDGGDTNGGAAELVELERRARALAPQTGARRAAALDELASRLSSARDRGGVGPSSGASLGDRPTGSSGAGAAHGFDAEGGSTSSNLTSTRALGTMSDPASGGTSSARTGAVEGGLGAVRWWPPVYDRLVARWFQSDPSTAR